MTSRRRGGLVAIVGVVAAFAATTARAEEPDAARAKALVSLREGNLLLEQGRAPDALAKFEEAYRTFPSPKLHYNLGQAHGAIAGHEVEAYQHLTLFLDQAKDANAELRAAAEAARSKQRGAIALVSVAVTPADATLLIDGAPADAGVLGAPRALKPGTHTLSLVKGTASSAPTVVTVRPGEATSVALHLEDARGGANSAPLAETVATAPPQLALTAPAGPGPGELAGGGTVLATPRPAQEDSGKPVYRRPWFWVIVGGVVAAATVTTIVIASSSHKSAWSNIPDVDANALR